MAQDRNEDPSDDSAPARETYEIDPATTPNGAVSDDPLDRDGPPGPEDVGGPALEGEDLPVEVKREFLVQVLLLNLGLLAIAIGAMLVYFRWWLDLGGGLIVIGLVAILLTYRRYANRPSVE